MTTHIPSTAGLRYPTFRCWTPIFGHRNIVEGNEVSVRCSNETSWGTNERIEGIPIMTATLRITHRSIGVEVRRGAYEIVLDGRPGGTVGMNQVVDLPVTPGHHSVQVRSGRKSSRVQSFEAVEGHTISFRCTGKSFLPIFLASFFIPSAALQLRRTTDEPSA